MSKKPNVVRGTTPAKRRRIATVDRSDLNEVLALKAGVINGGDVEIEKGMGFELRGSKYRPKRAWEATVTWEYGGDQYEHELNEDEIRSMVKSIEPPEDGESLSEIDFVEHEVKVVYEKRAPDKGGGGNEVRFEGKLDATLTSLSYGLTCVGRNVVVDGDVFQITRLVYTDEQVEGRYQTIDLKATAYLVKQGFE